MQKTTRKMRKPVPVRELTKADIEKGQFSGNLKQDCDALRAVLSASADLKERTIKMSDGAPCAVLYFANLTNLALISESIIEPLQRHGGAQGILHIAEQVVHVPEYKAEGDIYQVACALSAGTVAVLLAGEAEALLLPLLELEQRPIERAIQEDILIGPHESFSESLGKNLAILRRRVGSPDLKIKQLMVGRRSRTTVAIIYLAEVAQPILVAEMEKRIQRIDIDFTYGINYLTDFLDDEPHSVFPTLRSTEIPVRVVAALMEGRIAVMAEGDGSALIAPTFAPEFLQASEDYFDRPLSATFFRFIRMVGLMISVFLPGTWLALVSFHHGILPTPLFNSIQSGREGVPLPTVVEIFVLILAFDLIVEASTRMPTRIGQALGIVGGIILGQAAVQAGLVSPALVIIAALTGLAIFTQPSITFISVLRLLKYPVLIAGSLLGIYGVVWALIFMLITVTAIRSFGYPYMFPVAPFNLEGELDIFIGVPKLWHAKRQKFLSPQNERRLDYE
ncbi:MAG: spore germination protein [Peptococcaceae bacterium]|nr:spore germination protein [Peptococcaceae bacterium]